jgi:hypothetical protein
MARVDRMKLTELLTTLRYLLSAGAANEPELLVQED